MSWHPGSASGSGGRTRGQRRATRLTQDVSALYRFDADRRGVRVCPDATPALPACVGGDHGSACRTRIYGAKASTVAAMTDSERTLDPPPPDDPPDLSADGCRTPADAPPDGVPPTGSGPATGPDGASDHPTDPGPEAPTYSAAEAGRVLGVSDRRVRALAEAGRLTSVPGPTLRVLVSDIDVEAARRAARADRAADKSADAAQRSGGQPPDGGADLLPVPLSEWRQVMAQLGHLHEAGSALAEARERVGRAETRAEFLTEQLREARGRLADTATVPAAMVPPAPPLAAPSGKERTSGLRWWQRRDPAPRGE